MRSSLDELHAVFARHRRGAEGGPDVRLLSAKQDVVFYHWYPTPLVGSMDLVRLELPPYDAEKHRDA